MSLTTGAGKQLTRRQTDELPALLEFYSPTTAIIAQKPLGAARGMTWLIVALVVTLMFASAVIPIDVVVTAQGRVVSADPSIVVQPLDVSIVRSINVKEGQTVHKGQLLGRLDPTFTQSDQTSTQLQQDSLVANVERLKAEAAGVDYRPSVINTAAMVQQAIFAQRHEERALKRENYREKVASLQATLQRAAGDIQGYGERTQVANSVEQKRRELEKLGWGSQLNRLAAQDQTMEMKRNLDFATKTAQGAANDLAAMKAEAAGDERDFQAAVTQDLIDASRKLFDAQAAMTKASMHNKLVELRAVADSTVLTVSSVSVGSVMQPGDKFITLVPLDAKLDLEVALNGSDAGYVHLGDPATIKFDTFPYEIYGGARGKVTNIGADSFTNSTDDRTRAGVSNSADATAGTAYYRMNISMDEVTLHGTPSGFRVMSGMPVTTDVKVGKRTVMQYMLQRIAPTTAEGMREP